MQTEDPEEAAIGANAVGIARSAMDWMGAMEVMGEMVEVAATSMSRSARQQMHSIQSWFWKIVEATAETSGLRLGDPQVAMVIAQVILAKMASGEIPGPMAQTQTSG